MMPRLAPRVPELTDVLCEACGYVLNGLPPGGRCPECGKSIAESIGENRITPSWESSGPRKAAGFFSTSWALIHQPTHFYKTLAVRGSLDAARRFARIHWWLAGGLFAVTAVTHAFWYWFLLRTTRTWLAIPGVAAVFAGIVILMAVATYFSLDGITRLAARLTNWEASYRGIRLPYGIVLRGMYYHAAHYVPVAIAAATTVIGYQFLLFFQFLSPSTADRYLYILSGQVILSAVYLFQTYWIGMRNMMYANR